MRGVFDDDERVPAKPRRDTEFTLSPALQLSLFFGLVLICALCFGFGYAVGRHSSPEPSAASLQAGVQAPTLAATARPKPPATAQTYAPPSPANAAVNPTPPSGANANPAADSQTSYPSAGPSTPGQPQVRPALPPQADSPRPAIGSGANLTVEPALAPAGQSMVQIAAVIHAEDAEVLVNALRKRGYAVVARFEAADSLIHVRIGPFASREEANQWRQKLLNDGYNAIVQP